MFCCAGISQAAVSRGKSLVERVVKEQVSQSYQALFVCELTVQQS